MSSVVRSTDGAQPIDTRAAVRLPGPRPHRDRDTTEQRARRRRALEPQLERERNEVWERMLAVHHRR